MKIEYREFTLIDLERATSHNKEFFPSYVEAANDTERTERLANCQCHMCWYIRGRAGRASCTTTFCGGCKKEMQFGSTG